MTIMLPDEEYDKINALAERMPVLSMLLGIKPDLDRFVDVHGNPVGTTEIDAIQQVIVRDWETTRLRSEIWASTSLTEDQKEELILALNLFESYMHSELQNNTLERRRLYLRYVIDALKVLQENMGG